MTTWCSALFARRWPAVLAALVLGGLTTLSFAPYDLWWLSPLLCAPLYALLRGTSLKRRMLLGYCYGLGLFGTGTSWIYVSIHDVGGSPAIIAGLCTLIFVAGVALFYLIVAAFYRLLAPQPSPLEPLTFAAVWTLGEVFRGWFLTGFPWLLLGTAQVNGPLAGLAPVGGVFLASFVIVLSGALLWHLLAQRRLILLLPLVAIWGLSALLPTQWLSPEPRALNVALVQGNLPETTKWTYQGQQDAVNTYLDLTRTQAADADITVWPEAALPMFKTDAMPVFATAQSTLKPGSTLISGILTRQGQYIHNSALSLDQHVDGGMQQSIYSKHHLVPFGEYVPLNSILGPVISLLNLPAPSVMPGQPEQPPLTAAGLKLGVAICYEIAYPELVRDQALSSSMLLTISNDGWFGHSIGPLQHMQMAQMRALENNRYLIRDTSNGYTGVIAPNGKIVASIPRFKAGVLKAEVHPVNGLTLFTRTGNLPIELVCTLLVAIGAVASRWTRAASARAGKAE